MWHGDRGLRWSDIEAETWMIEECVLGNSGKRTPNSSSYRELEMEYVCETAGQHCQNGTGRENVKK